MKFDKKVDAQAKIFNKNIIELSLKNNSFRKELVTGKHSQVVLMNIKPGEDIGEEIHKVDQILVFTQGEGKAVLNDLESQVKVNSLVMVPAGTKHNFINTGSIDMKLFTIYAPAEHKPGTEDINKP